MRFNLIDRIDSISDTRLVGVKFVSLAEEYLADHFPTFPVLPGVLMLESLSQAAGWILHRRNGFGKSMAVLKEARNIRYGNFVAPGHWLQIDVESVSADADGGSFKASATVDGKSAVTGRLSMAYFNLAQSQPELADVDRRLIQHHRQRWDVLSGSQTTPASLG